MGNTARGSAVFHPAREAGGERVHREFQWPTAGRVSERRVVFFAGRCTAEAREVPRYNHRRPHSALADRTPAAFAELHRLGKEKASTSLGARTSEPLYRVSGVRETRVESE